MIDTSVSIVQPSNFSEKKSGRLTRHQRGYWAFIPNPLAPEISLSWALAAQISAAERGLSELAGIGRTLPNPHLLIKPFASREAVLSSRIEGTQASLSDLFYFEAANRLPTETSDVREVRNYVAALEYGIERLATLPISTRLMREIHAELMRGAGPHLTPGETRTTQNWIGPAGCSLNDATFVPPPPEDLAEALSEFEKFVHSPSPLPLVVRLALLHYQFEAIHPFLDGNGRIGRLLIVLLLCAEKVLPQPMLYLSAYFEKHRATYYRLLLSVSQRGTWDEWVSFFLVGLAEQSQDAIQRADKLLRLWQKYREQVQTTRSSALALRLVDELFKAPYVTYTGATEALGVTYKSGKDNVTKLVRAGILTELPGRKYARIFIAHEIVGILEAERGV